MLTYAQLARYIRAFESRWGGNGNTRQIELFIETYKTARDAGRRPGDPVSQRQLLFLVRALHEIMQEPLNVSAHSILRELDTVVKQAQKDLRKLADQRHVLEYRIVKLGWIMKRRDDFLEKVFETIHVAQAARDPNSPAYSKITRLLNQLESDLRRIPDRVASTALQGAQMELDSWDSGAAPEGLVEQLYVISRSIDRQQVAIQEQLDKTGRQYNAVSDILGN